MRLARVAVPQAACRASARLLRIQSDACVAHFDTAPCVIPQRNIRFDASVLEVDVREPGGRRGALTTRASVSPKARLGQAWRRSPPESGSDRRCSRRRSRQGLALLAALRSERTHELVAHPATTACGLSGAPAGCPLRVGIASSRGTGAVTGAVEPRCKALRPQHLMKPPFEPPPVAGRNDSLMAGSVSTSASRHCPQPLHSGSSRASEMVVRESPCSGPERSAGVVPNPGRFEAGGRVGDACFRRSSGSVRSVQNRQLFEGDDLFPQP